MTFEFSEDWPTIQAILTDPRCYRRMTGTFGLKASQGLANFAVKRCKNLEFVLARDGEGAAVAVFLIEGGVAVHFCFVPALWGRSLPVARAFIDFVWANTLYKVLTGNPPGHNRLARRLALLSGFADRGDGVLEIRKP